MALREFKRPKYDLAKENKAIGGRLRVAREAADLSQRQVASALGENQSWVSKVEQGERRADLAEGARMMRLYRVAPNTILMPEGLPKVDEIRNAADNPNRKPPKGAKVHRPGYSGPRGRARGAGKAARAGKPKNSRKS